MSNNWPIVPLRDVLALAVEAVPVDASATYPISGVYSFGRGLFARQPITGTETTYKFLHRLHSDDFVLSQLKGWEGALARVTNTFEGWFLSPQFQTFRALPNLLDISYLEWYCKLPSIWNELKNKSHGIGARRDSVYPAQFLSLSIPLPPLGEQQRIVARIEELAAKIEEARGLRREMLTGYEDLCRSILFGDKAELKATPMQELVRLREPDVFVHPDDAYHFAGIYSFGKGMFQGQHRAGTEIAYRSLTRLHTNDFVYPKLMAWEGAYAVVPSACNNLVVSTEFPVFQINQERVLPETLDVYFRTPSVWPVLSGVSTGTNARRRRLNPSDFLRFHFPLPHMDVQMQLRAVKQKVDALKRIQAETSAELDALLPSVLDKAFKGEL